MIQSNMKKGFGFTLIEVMVVIVMIGILAAIAVPIYTSYVYRARASEGVSTLGAIKSFMLERRSATGYWPTITDINNEFNGFTELYYFNKTIVTIPDFTSNATNKDSHIAVRLTASTNFDLPTKYTKSYIQLDIDWDGVNSNMGWSGDIRDVYAKHLPLCNSPKS